MVALLKYARARYEFLSLNLKSGVTPESPQFVRMHGDVCNNIKIQLKSVGALDVDSAMTLLKMITEGVNGCVAFTQSQQDALRDCINTKLDVTAGAAPKTATTTLDNPEEWLTKTIWAHMLADKLVAAKLCEIGACFGSAGITNPGEMFAKDVAAYALLNEVDNNSVLQGVNYTRMVKRYIRTVAEASAGTVGKSPSDHVNPQQLKENDPEWFKFMYQNKFEPAEISIEMKVRLTHVRNLLACRSTKHCCRSAPQPMLQQVSLLGNQIFPQMHGQWYPSHGSAHPQLSLLPPQPAAGHMLCLPAHLPSPMRAASFDSCGSIDMSQHPLHVIQTPPKAIVPSSPSASDGKSETPKSLCDSEEERGNLSEPTALKEKT